MFIILFYDVNVKRVAKMLKTCRKYLIHVQNSVLEGEITKSDLYKLVDEIKNLIKDKDSVIYYVFRTMKYSERKVIGEDKKQEINFI